MKAHATDPQAHQAHVNRGALAGPFSRRGSGMRTESGSGFAAAQPRHSFARVSVSHHAAERDEMHDGLAGAGEYAGLLVDQAVAGPVAPAAPPPAGVASAVTATLPAHIRATNTPAAMTADRIPPSKNTAVDVKVSGWHAPLLNVVFSVAGSGGSNGSVTINGAATAEVNADTTVQLRGGTQTAPGNGGNLHLIAELGGVRLATSPGFSVAAIIQDVVISFNSALTGARRGVVVDTTWSSDSGSLADLDQVEFSEQVQYDAGSGVLAGAGATAQNSGYLPSINAPLTDTHGTPASILTGPGAITAEQVFIFKDARTGANDIPTRNSGFRIRRNVTEPTPGNVSIMTSKAGTATTANGHASAAGAGSVSRTQAV